MKTIQTGWVAPRTLLTAAILSSLLAPLQADRKPVSEQEAIVRMHEWMRAHPVMRAASDWPIESVQRFPPSGFDYSVRIVSLSPQGYVVLNSDDRLPPVVAFSASSSICIEDVPENALRAALLAHVERTARRLVSRADAPPSRPAWSMMRLSAQSTEVYGPYLDTKWSQWHPYNLYCPADPAGSSTSAYRQRAPTGCVPTAFSQIFCFHRWPPYGQGLHSYHDATGVMTGEHSAVFSDPYGLQAMAVSFDAFATSAQPGQEEVAELMYELGVAAEADFESATIGTGVSSKTLAQEIAAYFYYEPAIYHNTQEDLLAALDANLRAGYPAVVSLSNHVIVVDGLMTQNESISYHFNYGWGGQNDGWWSANEIPLGPITAGCTSVRPSLLPMPRERRMSALAGQPIELQWIFPKRREHEAARLDLRQLVQQPGLWSSDASTLDQTASMRWEIRSGGQSGNCWYAGPNGYASLTLADQFVPDSSSHLSFWTQYRLGTAAFTVSISADDGETFSEKYRLSDNYPLEWRQHTVPLGAYAGQTIQLRFELHSGSYYPENGGVWIDDLLISSGSWYRWEPFVSDTQLASHRFSAALTPWDECSDFSRFELTTPAGSTDEFPDWTIAAIDGQEHCFYKQAGGYRNMVCHLTSRAQIAPKDNTRLLLRWKRHLANDRFRILISTNRSVFTELWSAGGHSVWIDQAIPLADYAGQPVYVRLEYSVPGSYYPSGGVWIDSIHLQEDVVHPELEGQPIHYTLLTNLAAGSYVLAAAIEDQAGTVHRQSPSFELLVCNLFDVRSEPNGAVTVTGYHGTNAHLTIPSSWNAKPLTGIAAGAFAGAGLTSAIFPPGLTCIEDGAFSGANGLRRIYFQGDAPAVGANAFPQSELAVYYLHGTAGWNPTFAGHPTALWNVVIQSAREGFGPGPGGCRLLFTGPPDHPAVIEACTDLATGIWSAIHTNTLANGSGEFTDPALPGSSGRFYRVLLQSL